MPAPNAISSDKLARIIGTPRAPLLLHVWSEEDFAADPRLLPDATRVDNRALAALVPQLGRQPSIAVCQAGHRRSQGTAAWLHAEGCVSEYLQGGFEAWRSAGLPLIDPGKLRAPEAAGLLAASFGLSRMYSDDLEQVGAGMLLCDAFYRWARDATDETHNWPTNKPKAD